MKAQSTRRVDAIKNSFAWQLSTNLPRPKLYLHTKGNDSVFLRLFELLNRVMFHFMGGVYAMHLSALFKPIVQGSSEILL